MRPLPFLLLLTACADDVSIPLHFDGPTAAAVLPAGAGPFDEPAGFVANSRSGAIVPLDLKAGRLLTDDTAASFLRASAVTTGQARILSDVAVVSDDTRVTLWAADQAFAQLLRAPYVTEVDEGGAPVEVVPELGEVTFVDADGSGDAASLADVQVRAGFTTTEDWSIEFDGTRWWAKGSRSGTQIDAPVTGEPWHSDAGELAFTLDGTASAGDYFSFRTETGVEEFVLDGPVMGLLARDGVVYAAVASTPGRVFLYDGLEGSYLGAVELPAGAQPTRLAGAPDGRVFVADGQQSVAWVLRFDQDPNPATVPVESLTVAAPLVDLAYQGGTDRDGVAFEHLFVAPLGLQRVDVYDLAGAAWVDPNPITAVAEGIFLGAPVVGLAASAGDVWLRQADAWGAFPRVPTVAVATADGIVTQLEASTGCGVTDERGPYVPNPNYDANSSVVTLVDAGEPSDTEMVIDDATYNQVVPSGCGGVSRTETWTVMYDSATLSWEVEGSMSGVQVNRAYEDERYLSDDGAVSFLLAPGGAPSTDGDAFEFQMYSGLLLFSGNDADEDGTVDLAWEFPGRPVAFDYTTGPTGGGWDEVDRRQFALLPVINGDLVARLHLDSGKTETDWQ